MPAQLRQLERDEWLWRVRQFCDHNYRHMWDYGVAMARRRGAECEYVAVCRGVDVIALAAVRLKGMPLWGGGIAYISGGPLVRQGLRDDAECLTEALHALAHDYVDRREFVLRVLAPVGAAALNHASGESFARAGFVPTDAMAGYRTLLVQIGRPLVDVRKALLQKWRNCLNSAERNGLTIREGTDDAIFAEFSRMFGSFHRRKGFAVDLGADFYRLLQRQLDDGEKLLVSLAEKDARPVAGHVCSMLGDTCVYLLGASEEEGLQTKASYLLQWNAILKAHARGFRYYDLGGIDPEGNPSVQHFKAGLGGDDVIAPGVFEFTSMSLRSRLSLLVDRLYRAARKRRGSSTVAMSGGERSRC